MKGDTQFNYQWKDVNWCFSSKENSEIFKENLEKYVPQYGGYCAYAMGAKGEKSTLILRLSRLLMETIFISSHFFHHTLTNWNKDENALKTKTDANWTKYVKKLELEYTSWVAQIKIKCIKKCGTI